MLLDKMSAKRSIIAMMVILALAIFGPFAAESRANNEDIDRVPPTITVVTSYTGAPAQDVEIYVTQVLEESIMGVRGIKLIASQSREGRSQISIEFAPNRDVGTALGDVREAVARVIGKLPSYIEAPNVRLGEVDTGQISQRSKGH